MASGFPFEIPFDAGVVTDALANIDLVEKKKDPIFGKDVQFPIVVTAKGDYKLVNGEENLRRAMIRRFIVRQGEYRTNPQFGVGLGTYSKKPKNRATLDTLKNATQGQLGRDRRVDKVINLETNSIVSDQGREGLQVKVSVQAKGRTIKFQPFNFNRTV